MTMRRLVEAAKKKKPVEVSPDGVIDEAIGQCESASDQMKFGLLFMLPTLDLDRAKMAKVSKLYKTAFLAIQDVQEGLEDLKK